MIGSESAISCFRRAAAAEQQIDHARGKIKMGGAVQGGKGPPLHRRFADTNGSGVSRTCGAENSTIPSAVFS
jgi:hypothetical protein